MKFVTLILFVVFSVVANAADLEQTKSLRSQDLKSIAKSFKNAAQSNISEEGKLYVLQIKASSVADTKDTVKQAIYKFNAPLVSVKMNAVDTHEEVDLAATAAMAHLEFSESSPAEDISSLLSEAFSEKVAEMFIVKFANTEKNVQAVTFVDAETKEILIIGSQAAK